MDPNSIMTPATGAISSRFESQSSIDEARENRKKEWAEAYARIGQEPPPEEPETDYDARTLYERLQAQKELKKEEWDSKMKLSNQWRGLNADEQRFLAEKEAEKRAEQKKLEEREAEEMRAYRERLAARNTSQADDSPPIVSAVAKPAPPKKIPSKDVKKKDMKSLMKGVVVKKKPKAPAASSVDKPSTASEAAERPDSSSSKPSEPEVNNKTGTKREAPSDVTDAEDEKRQKLEEDKA
ncbi:hypothetical protein C343_04083 [Cryptococcus neoformans C23]|uniref:FAM192A/Fyv6 N-terminal domain-containing protein n=2 Tax=Cryptococcus neoformans TaxID=5207 RepID=A0A854QHK3_CRYNE|nr:hypothetical protein CNAG_06686 [Cryptococcus neoformans var. grubii H99]AUB25835.1 hypothetical protein CKF44_06686 [Cryptococcus neoformans var. grubii]OWZ30810.1 hypothetical protein C347_04144 [Cryptococcus neoformans var. grubii AD2-60a]OWZ39677.1 hypothetical protein C353_03993 [Cryptococcus neoformans var. grubii AD1-83a]OWZ43042.1 hypothetical protein C343_04083 [Cryptococcus neoformans var. grubii C23]OWZ53699.1 hypothetical protein C368_04085 [Cryptococcus neoformans var. grubii 1|eukprot:XP_012050777.1 hypothetical protein CNAG_06686 [Cryptococcus neoformans var. grubii H99]